jgi:hypothetical protein
VPEIQKIPNYSRAISQNQNSNGFNGFLPVQIGMYRYVSVTVIGGMVSVEYPCLTGIGVFFTEKIWKIIMLLVPLSMGLLHFI